MEVRVFSWAPLFPAPTARPWAAGTKDLRTRSPGPLKPKAKSIEVHKNDLPAGLDLGGIVAVDTETRGLKLERDRLCLVQVSAGDGNCHLVQFPDGGFDAPNLKALITDKAVIKIFHYARFDMAAIQKYLGVWCEPVYCTKIASILARTYTDRHGLKDVCKELLGVELSKDQQSSDWAAETLTPEQIKYAAADVLFLHELRAKLDAMLAGENRRELAEACFGFLKTRVELDLAGWRDEDVFAH
ncbi:MAG: ribonuclease D [Rhodospirillaceae bacterium]|nr:ribonuclease D [Rhodospirillaceae bacterium]